ncbi:MAG: acetyl-CoA carboxylase biotin carboxyl carrier protein [Thermomicrobiales bacterium]
MDSFDKPSSADKPTLGDLTAAVKALGETMRANNLEKVDVALGSVKIRLRAGRGPARSRSTRTGRIEEGDEVFAVDLESSSTVESHVVTSPMIGTFYTAANPSHPPFVAPGDRVEVGQTIGIIEAMKIMNEIPSDGAGIVEELLAPNAQAVEYGSPLLRLRLAGVAE